MDNIVQPIQSNRIFLFSAFILIFFFTLTSIFCQAKFQKHIGGGGSIGYDVIRTTDGGYAISALTTSFGAINYDFYIIKLSGSFDIQWTKVIGGNSSEYGFSIAQSTDGGIVVAGATSSSFGAGSQDCYVVKVDATGNLLWTRTIGGSANEGFQDIINTSDGCYIAAGGTNSFGQGSYDGYAVKLDNAGNIQWTRTIGGAGSDNFNSVVQNPDGSYVFAGYTSSFGKGGYDIYIAKLSSNGAFIWAKTVGGGYDEIGTKIVRTFDGGYVVAGYTKSFVLANEDFYIIKINSSGSLLWTRTIGGPNLDIASDLVQTTDSGYVMSGRTNSFGDQNVYVVKVNSTGVLQWTRVVEKSGFEAGFSILQTSDGGYLVCGYDNGGGNVYLVKLDAAGTVCNNSTTGGTTSSGGAVDSGGIVGTGGIYGTGGTVNGSGGVMTTFCIVSDVKNVSGEIPAQFSLSQNYPNPFNPVTIINYELPITNYVKLSVYDVLGKEIAVLVNEKQQAGIYKVEWDASNYPSGVYFYKLITQGYSETKKMVLVK